MSSQSNYAYPDKSDYITQKMIAQNGNHYVKYWTYSEEKLLEKLFSMPFFARKPLSMLDVGCGEGRLFPYLVKKATSIVGLEPDARRCETAKRKAGELNAIYKDCHIVSKKVAFNDAEDLSLYDVVLSSHVIQHIASKEVEAHLEKLVNHTAPQGIVIIHTTYTDGDEDVYTKSFVDEDTGQWIEIDVLRDKFDALINNEGVLPVHKFAIATLVNKMESLGYELVTQTLFHADKKMVEEFGVEQTDLLLNSADRKYYSRGRDVSLVFKKSLIIKKGGLVGFYSFPINFKGVGSIDVLAEKLGANCLSDIPCENQENKCKGQCIKIMRDFHGRTDTSVIQSVFLGNTNLIIPLKNFGMVPVCFWIDFFPQRNAGIICCNMVLRNKSVKEIIALKNFLKTCRRIDANPSSWNKIWESINDEKTVSVFCDQIVDTINRSLKKVKSKSGVFINDFDFHKSIELQYSVLEMNEVVGEGLCDAEHFVRQHKQEMYGLLTGDEGFKYVPDVVAEKRLTDSVWQTRSFTHFTCFGKNAIMINGKRQVGEYLQDQTDYIDHCEIDNEISRNRKAYFQMNACLAGVDHGILDAVEDVLVTSLELQYIHSSDFKETQHDTYRLRQKLIDFLQSNQFRIEEMNGLKQVISTSLGIPESIEESKSILEYVTDDINIHDQINLNTLMTGLTLATVVVGLFTIWQEEEKVCVNNSNYMFTLFILFFVIVAFVCVLHEFSFIKWCKRKIKSIGEQGKKKNAAVITIALLCASMSLSAQSYSPCYTSNMAKGDALFKQGKYSDAKTYYVNAKQCNGGNPEEAQKKINQCNAKLNATSQKNTTSVTTDAAGNQIFTVNGVTFKMVYVQGGTFTMGSTSEQDDDFWGDARPSHQVSVSDIYIGETEVTQALWKAVMVSNPSNFKGDDLPVEQVSWDDCLKFIKKLNALTGKTFRLPTEAEWEYAARGGNRSRHYKYAGSNSVGDVAWYEDNSGSTTHPVKGKLANELGLYDMSGNVGEWCSDWHGNYNSAAQTNPRGPSSGSDRVTRGGCWFGYTGGCQVFSRSFCTPNFPLNFNGFRLVLVRQ